MQVLRRLAASLAFLIPALATAFAMAEGAAVQTKEVRAELQAYAPEGIAPGKPAWLGLSLTHSKDWHTYWKNPGDSGLATYLRWRLAGRKRRVFCVRSVARRACSTHLACHWWMTRPPTIPRSRNCMNWRSGPRAWCGVRPSATP